MGLKVPMGSVRFPILSTVYTALPPSNTDSERTFSMMRKLNIYSRSNLLAKTTTSYLQCKINFDRCCHKFQVSSAMIRDAKHACYDNKLECQKKIERGGDLLRLENLCQCGLHMQVGRREM